MQRVTHNKTKIIATIGPASRDKKMLRALVTEGVDVFRLNFSHGSYEEYTKIIEDIHAINEEMNVNVAIIQDLQGPKIRVNEVKDDTVLVKGETIIITTQKVLGDKNIVSTSYQGLPDDVTAGESILIDDGKIELLVKKIEKKEVICEVVYGGVLKSRKGINLPYSNVSAPSLTEKDMADLEFGMKSKIDWVALSFVRSSKDIDILRAILVENNSTMRIIAKIEKPGALENLDAIVVASDALMVARGDLGVEILMEEVPMVQKMMIEKCNNYAKPVIVATQMMESMIESPRPTRAETNDVANAVIDGADALMLSAETATGKYPVEVIRSMVRTIESVECESRLFYRFREIKLHSPIFLSDSIILAACKLAKEVNAKAIVGMTSTGYSAFKTSSHRPNVNIFIFTENKSAINALSLVWATHCYFYEKQTSTDDTIADMEAILKRDGHVQSGDIFISLASMPIQVRNRTNMMKINVVK